ncbi:hypothetical protein Asulf_01825 [Archaeoglobus sulfaticallidus PM70-1]|uniref:UPF0280 protein Asulf_01825 n=1 Tax=Archaeoglobus sulfaticallidus PM70-1 TaxID=387631 RepID=N0BMD9_9EURY|nr:UPF0280 family protein [Archaeoglobus sulfaticallidus]AGK61796.1 hypothetical protein Asulf_01825 [Archaeoglobus sulfaticallidus PM70-1]
MYKRYKFKHKETIVTVLLKDERYYQPVIDGILEARRIIEDQISRDPYFLIAYEPYNEVKDAKLEFTDDIITEMFKASWLANVGPMASVAGTIAGYAVNYAKKSGADFAVVDNGGDIAMFGEERLTIGVYAQKLKVGFELNPSDMTDSIYSICTSSGTIGHSVSFGYADAVTVFSSNPAIADAFATRICNEIGKDYGKSEIKEVLERFWMDEFIDGILVIKEEIIGKIGRVPRLKKVEFDADLITKG